MRKLNERLSRLSERPWYLPFAVAVVVISFLASVFSSVGVLALTVVRESDRAALLECTDARDKYAEKSSQALRDATQDRDDLAQERGRATIAKERALVKWTDILISALADQSGQEASNDLVLRFAQATAALNAAASDLQDTERALRTANRDLTTAREENPVVPPASEVCATGEFIPPKKP